MSPAILWFLSDRSERNSPPQRRNLCFVLGIFRRLRTATYFARVGKVGKAPPGADSPCQGEMSRSDRGGRDHGSKESLRPTASGFRSPFPRTPYFTGESAKSRHLRPARRPQERCAKIITAVLLNELDRLLLQDDLRLSCRTYTVGGGRWAESNPDDRST